MPGTPGIPAAAATGGIAVLVQPPPGFAVPAWVTTAVAAVHAGGTDLLPTIAAWLVPAVMPPALDMPAEATAISGTPDRPAELPAAPALSQVLLPSPGPIGGRAASS